MIKTECINCTKSNYCGKDSFGNLRFGCNNSFCVKEDVVPNKYRDEILQEYKNGGKNS
jgi:hypothetical protein